MTHVYTVILRFVSVILSEAKDLRGPREILRSDRHKALSLQDDKKMIHWLIVGVRLILTRGAL